MHGRVRAAEAAGGRGPDLELGEWLRTQRHTRGWAVWEMARQLREAGRASGDPNVPSIEAIGRNIRRWEGGVGGVSERYRLYYCKALGIGPAEFGPATVQRQVRAGVLSAAGRQWVAAVLGDVRDGLRDDAKQCEARAEQVAADPVRSALCRGQAHGLALAAAHIDATVSGTILA